MSGLYKSGVDVNPFGSKFSEKTGGLDAGNGMRTYTKPSYTLFVVGIPDAESSDSIEKVFAGDRGFLQCRPVGHKLARRMVFVDYDSIPNATTAMQAHQGHKWEEIDEGLKIDFDQDAREKRNTALDQGLYEKFWAVGPRVPKAASEAELWSKLRAEALEEKSKSLLPTKTPVVSKRPRAKASLAAHLRVKGSGDGGDVRPGPSPGQTLETGKASSQATAPELQGMGCLAGYGSDSGDEDDEDDDEDEEEEEEQEDADAGDSKRQRVSA